ncbi:MAG: choice-of-anchor D domain-containing protein [Terriglobia bacterium]|jgi:VCBS repeat-containing protein
MTGLQRTTDNGPRTGSLIQNPKSKIENEFVRLRLVGAKPGAEVIGREELPGKVNYFIGNDPKKWRTNVPTYAKVRYHDVYPGVDLEYYGNQGGQLEYDFIVAPGADPSAITLQLGAVREPPLRIDANGDLVIAADGGEIRFHKPEISQPGTGSSLAIRHSSLIDGRFVLDARNRIQFALGPYDHTKPLVIDPVLTYSTYLGGSGGDWGYGIAVDSSGSAYVTGETASVDFPTVNPLQAGNKSGSQGTAFVAKLNPAGSALVYSTYLGGSGADIGYGIAVDSSGNAYVGGRTYSRDFPVVNAIQNGNLTSTGYSTGFIAKLDASGSALVYSTYLGGSVFDFAAAIAVDPSGNAYVTGATSSPDFPTTPGSFESTGGGNVDGCQCTDAFVTELNAAGSALVYSTYLGEVNHPSGNEYTSALGIALDHSGNAYITGSTTPGALPTANPLQAASKNANFTAFVTELNASGSGLVYSTYLGGSDNDEGRSIAVDSSGAAYVTGATSSSDFPTVNPIQPTNEGIASGGTAGFVSKLNPGGSALVYSTYLGGSGTNVADGIAVDSSGDAYVVGYTGAMDFPTANAVQPALLGSENGFVAELNPAGSALVYSTYLGGSYQDAAAGVALDPSGNAYITGATLSLDFPTVNPLQPANKNAQPPGPTAFVAELSASPAPAVSFSPAAFGFGAVLENTTSPQETFTVTNLGNASLNINGITASGDFAVVSGATSCFYTDTTVAPEASCKVAVTFTPTALGDRTGAVTVAAASGGPWALQLTGTGAVSAANFSPASLFFNHQNIGTTSSPQVVTLTNTASVALAVSSVTVPSGWTQTNNCVPSVGPNASCTINVSFQPTVAGFYTSLLTVTDAAVNSPQTVQMTGTGAGGQASLSATSLTFGDQPVNSTSIAQTIMLLNPNNGGTGVPELSVSGDFQQQNVCDSLTGLTVDTPCPISISFMPTAAGTRTGTLTVTYTSPTPLTLTVSLTGTGVAPEASVSPTALVFGNQALGSASSPMALTLSNTGSPPLSVSSFAMSGAFSETNTCGNSVAANSSCAINVVFTPTAPGPQTGTLTITDNSNYVPGGTIQTVNLSGTGAGPVVSLSTTALSFAAQTVSSQSAPQTITLTNAGNGTLTTLKFARTGDFAQTNTCGDSVAAGSSCTISVTFSPIDAGTRNGTLTLTDNASTSPQTVELSGAGTDFAMSSTTTSQTVTAGQTANYSFTVGSEDGFSQAVNLVCTGAPSESTCTLTPNTVTPNGTVLASVAVAVSTTAPSTARLAPPAGRLLPPGFTGLGRVFWLYGLLGLASVAVLATARKRRAACLLAACLLLAMLWSACGGGSSTPPPKTVPGTPAGTYTVAVTGTAASTSTLTHTIQFTLTVN